MPLTVLCCSIYPLPQVLDPLPSTPPINGSPRGVGARRSDITRDSIFHAGSVPLQKSIGEDLREVAAFQRGAKVEPLSRAFPRAFACARILYPLRMAAFLAVSLLGVLSENA